MNSIRPSFLPPGSAARDSGKLAAQRAFFAAVTGEAQAPASAAQPAAAAVTAEPRAAREPSDTPQKILRPGSLIDIRV